MQRRAALHNLLRTSVGWFVSHRIVRTNSIGTTLDVGGTPPAAAPPQAHEKIVAEDLSLGYGSVTAPASGTAQGNKIGLHTFLTTTLNVLDFCGDGTDPIARGAAIKTAYDQLVALGAGELWIPAGSYVTATPLKPHPFITIRGAGQHRTRITYTGPGFWLDNIDTGTILACFRVEGLSCTLTTRATGFCRMGDINADFSENNQHIECVFRDLQVTGVTPIVAGSRALQLSTFIRTTIEDCLFFDFDIVWELKRFDVGWVKHNRIQRFGTYGLYLHNDGGSAPAVSDETVFIQNEILEVKADTTAAIYVDHCENARFIATFIEPTGGTSPLAWKLASTAHCSIYGGTISLFTKAFDLTDCRGLTIEKVQTIDSTQAPTATVTYTYDPDGPFGLAASGLVQVVDCGYSIANAFKGIPGVIVFSGALNGPALSTFGGSLGGVSGLYGSQVLDRQGTVGVLKEADLVIGPFNANTYLAGPTLHTASIVADPNASRGYAIKVPQADSIQMAIPYPADILPGCYEIVARIRHKAPVTGALFAVWYDGAFRERFAGVDTLTTYQIVSARFRFAPAGPATQLQIHFALDQDLYVDYLVLRPAFNSVAIQEYSPHDVVKVGTNTGFVQVYASTPPTAGVWRQGDIAWNTAPTAGGTVGWICISGGGPGTWKAFGMIAS